MLNGIKHDFPNIHRYREQLGVPWGQMEHLYSGMHPSLRALDAALDRIDLDPNNRVLRGVAKDLFSDDFEKLDAATCEILAFAWLSKRTGFSSKDVGYPATWPTDDPPFDGVLHHGRIALAFDVKEGSGAGILRLRRHLQDIANKVAAGASAPRVEVSVDGPCTQHWFAENRRAIGAAFRGDLEENGISSGEYKYPATSGHVIVAVNGSAGVSVTGLHEMGSFVAGQISKHASKKAERLAHTEATSFFLIYVRRPMSSLSDFPKEAMTSILNFLAARKDLPDSLSGVLMLDFNDLAPEAFCWARSQHLAKALRGSAELYRPTPTLAPSERRAVARSLPPAALHKTPSIVMDSCDLRGEACEAPGSTGAMRVFFHAGEQFNCCGACEQQFGWTEALSEVVLGA